MNEQSRIWNEIGLRFLFQPSNPSPNAQTRHRFQATGGRKHDSTEVVGSRDPVFSGPLLFYWQRIQSQIPVYILITYNQLDNDFRFSSNSQRAQLLQAIITSSGWPSESVAFWPVILHDTPLSNFAQDTTRIYEILTLLKPKYLLDFGETMDLISPNKDIISMQQDIFFTQRIVLPSLEAMLPDNKHVKMTAWNIIRTLVI